MTVAACRMNGKDQLAHTYSQLPRTSSSLCLPADSQYCNLSCSRSAPSLALLFTASVPHRESAEMPLHPVNHWRNEWLCIIGSRRAIKHRMCHLTILPLIPVKWFSWMTCVNGRAVFPGLLRWMDGRPQWSSRISRKCPYQGHWTNYDHLI